MIVAALISFISISLTYRILFQKLCIKKANSNNLNKFLNGYILNFEISKPKYFIYLFIV